MEANRLSITNVLLVVTIVAAVGLLLAVISQKKEAPGPSPEPIPETSTVVPEKTADAATKEPALPPAAVVFRTRMASQLEPENGIYYLEVEGSPYEMGHQHGRALKDQIIDAVADYKANVTKMFGRENAAKIFKWALNTADFKRSILQVVPHTLEELRGIADGAGVSEDDLLLANMYEEVYEAAPLVLGITPMAGIGQGCTAFTAIVGSRRFAGQNMDFSGNLHGKQLVVRYRYPDHQVLMYGFVGQIGGIGVNSHGLSVFVNNLPQGKKRKDDGLGSTFMLRMLLEQESVDAALAKLAKVPRFGGINYTLTDARKGVIAETDADQVIPREQTESMPFVVGTNHVLHLDHRHDMPGLYENGEPVPASISLTLERMAYTRRLLDALGHQLTVDDLKGLLTVTPVNIYHPAFMTLQSAIVVYDGEQIRFLISGGHDPQRDWDEYQFH